jgi:CHAT domain-containing protein
LKGERIKSTPIKLLDEIVTTAWEQILLRELYRVLIKPVEHCLLEVEELLILPHKELFEVPWAALVDENGHYLMQRHIVRIAPSLRVSSNALKRLQPHVSTCPGHALVVGNPSPNLIGDLPQAEEEAKIVADILNSAQMEVRSLNKQVAIKSKVKESLQGASWAHMALHGDLDTDSLVLAIPWVGPENASAPQSAQVEATASPTAAENLPATQLVQTVKAVPAECLQAPQEANLPQAASAESTGQVGTVHIYEEAGEDEVYDNALQDDGVQNAEDRAPEKILDLGRFVPEVEMPFNIASGPPLLSPFGIVGLFSQMRLFDNKASSRFTVGSHVQCKHPERGWSKPWVTGRVQAQNFEQPAGIFNAYQIRLDNGAGTMIIERDHDEFVKKFIDVEEDEQQAKEINLPVAEIQRDVKLASGATVVLSACNTGRGQIKAEGVMGLTRGLFIAGAASTLVSLWSVDDGSTALLMQLMYQYLVHGLSVPHALRLAMLRMARRHPIQNTGAGSDCEGIWQTNSVIRGDNDAKFEFFLPSVSVESLDDTDMPDLWRRPLYWASFLVVGASTHLPGVRTSAFETSVRMAINRQEETSGKSSALCHKTMAEESAGSLPCDQAHSEPDKRPL